MNVTNDMAEAALDALDDACIGFNRSNPRASVHWKGFTRDDRVAAMRTALSAALAKQDAAIALMRGQSEESEADALRRRLHKLADYWIEITRDQDIAYKDRPLLEMYDKGLTKCATDLRNKLAEGHSR